MKESSLNEKGTAEGSEKLLMETAALAGEIMLVSGAEIYRVEDTMCRMLALAGDPAEPGFRNAEVVATVTGIFATLNPADAQVLTIVRRISHRATNLNRIYLVNHVSRNLCAGTLTVEQAYEELERIRDSRLYSGRKKHMAAVGVAVFFAVLLGGNGWDALAAAVTGVCLAAAGALGQRFGLNDFCLNAFSAFAIACCAMGLECLGPWFHREAVITASIMPLVPGVVFTTAIRDTLNGDYASGMARILEAVVVALAVAAGVGGGITVFQWIAGGLM